MSQTNRHEQARGFCAQDIRGLFFPLREYEQDSIPGSVRGGNGELPARTLLAPQFGSSHFAVGRVCLRVIPRYRAPIESFRNPHWIHAHPVQYHDPDQHGLGSAHNLRVLRYGG